MGHCACRNHSHAHLCGEINLKNKAVYIILFVVAAWNLAYKLDMQPIFLWDESRQANNAIEMAQTNNFLYPTYDQQPDFWNTKPHLLIVFQAICFKILGPSELSLRLPSLIASCLLIFIWLRFFYQRNWPWAGVIFVLVLLSCRGFNVYHVARTGDYDALLLLFISAMCMELYAMIFENGTAQNSRRFMFWFSLAVLTKSLAAVLWIPVVGLVILIFAHHKVQVIKSILKEIWIPVGVVLTYYIYRELSTPGYINAVWNNEIVGRYFAANEGHVTSWYYYFEQLYSHYFEGFIFIIIPAIISIYAIKTEWRKDMFFLVMALCFLTVISLSATRIDWYMAPAIVLLSIFLGVSFQHVISRDRSWLWYVGALLSGFVVWQYPLLWEENTTIDGVQPRVVLKKAVKQGKMPYDAYWLCENYKPLEKFYSQVLKEKNIELKLTEQFQFKQKDTLLLYHWNFVDSIEKYNYSRQIVAPTHDFPMWVFVVDSSRINAVNIEKPSKDILTKSTE